MRMAAYIMMTAQSERWMGQLCSLHARNMAAHVTTCSAQLRYRKGYEHGAQSHFGNQNG
jgi:hypothetical protein